VERAEAEAIYDAGREALVVTGAVLVERARFQIPLSIRACGFPAHGLPMIFLAQQRVQQTPDVGTPPGESHPTRTVWRAARRLPAAWPLPIACNVAMLAQPTGKRPSWPFRLPTARWA
jgi:hypothetical protein